MSLLYYDAETANAELIRAREKVSAFRKAARMAGRLCHLRRSNFCYIDCDCRMVCDVSGLVPLRWDDLPEVAKTAIRGEYPNEEDSFE